jgi:TfoX/Sxy family transcriptional regulator of competence genes
MAFSLSLANRIRDLTSRMKDISEKKMFGGLCFFFRNHLLVGVWHDSLIARIGIDAAEEALLESHVNPFGRPGHWMKGWVVIDPEGIDREEDLQAWFERALEFVETLPPKEM